MFPLQKTVPEIVQKIIRKSKSRPKYRPKAPLEGIAAQLEARRQLLWKNASWLISPFILDRRSCSVCCNYSRNLTFDILRTTWGSNKLFCYAFLMNQYYVVCKQKFQIQVALPNRKGISLHRCILDTYLIHFLFKNLSNYYRHKYDQSI